MNTDISNNMEGMTKLWTSDAWDAALPVIRKIQQHPFVQGLKDGSLPKSNFIHYLEQDMIYLKNYGEEMEMLSKLMPIPPMKQLFSQIASDGVQAEEELHQFLAETWNVHPATVVSGSTQGYMDFTRHYLESDDPALAIAALLPCFWVYNEVGHFIADTPLSDDHPYKAWIQTYESEEMNGVVNQVIDFANQLAAESTTAKQVAMRNIFVEAVRWEYRFFDQNNNMKYQRVLTIAGSDSSGGAGIQADIKSISANGCYAASAITAITAQNTVGVSMVQGLPISLIEGQIDAVLSDIGADSVKIGMLHSGEVVRAVAGMLKKYEMTNIVLDPVMVAKSGDKLIEDEAIEVLKTVLMPMARVITPNIPEAEILLGESIQHQDEMPAAAQRLGKKYGVSVLLKAGHMSEEQLVDIFYNYETDETTSIASQRVHTCNVHGTGCTLSSAFAAQLAKGLSLTDAARAALKYISEATLAGSRYEIGHGHGPVCHFYK